MARPKQRHSAGCPVHEVRITYRFHPRAGDFVTVIGVRRHAGADHFVIRQPDRTLALLPAWMANAAGLSCELVQHPKLPLEKLNELHALVSAHVTWLREDSLSTRGAADEGAETQPRGFIRTNQIAGGASARGEEDADAAAPALLVEAAAQGTREENGDRIGEEDGNDQDYV
ncbi:hypothetical protein [Mesorhizobium captivum]|uniref:hypothetical protein n=1 Tax=Mesorhizobium captivum TaxID=3072319 RepID=UPI002A23ABED|nr:hypothetical protein [Mesorhizobium sp. VK23E]MDX8514614.1 hypothetical protein [Mesorhizobium sp. VK23E]